MLTQSQCAHASSAAASCRARRLRHSTARAATRSAPPQQAQVHHPSLPFHHNTASASQAKPAPHHHHVPDLPSDLDVLDVQQPSQATRATSRAWPYLRTRPSKPVGPMAGFTKTVSVLLNFRQCLCCSCLYCSKLSCFVHLCASWCIAEDVSVVMFACVWVHTLVDPHTSCGWCRLAVRADQPPQHRGRYLCDLGSDVALSCFRCCFPMLVQYKGTYLHLLRVHNLHLLIPTYTH